MRLLAIMLFTLLSFQIHAQRTSLSYELNGRHSNKEIQDSLEISKNPFAKFIGEWTLKDDTWIQNWGGANDTIKIPMHHTLSNKINTDNSLLSIIDGPEPNGHIFWSFNPNTKEVSHLSSFGAIRAGVGQGEFYGDQNLRLKISFEGEAAGTYRIYTYEWVSDSEYALNSIQYDKNDTPTGLFYKGNFIRIKKDMSVRREMEEILKVLDDNSIPKEEQVSVYTENVVHMAPNHVAIDNKQDLLDYLKEQSQYGYAKMKHEIIEFSSHDDIVIMRGQVTGVFHPSNGGQTSAFQTKNLFVFERVDGNLKIAKVIYNMAPNP